MERCTICGRIDTPLQAGICPACRLAPNVHQPGLGQVRRRFTCAAPSVFLFACVVVAALGEILLLVARQMRNSLPSVSLVYLGFACFAVAGILLTVGIIRWAVWPLIEASRKD